MTAIFSGWPDDAVVHRAASCGWFLSAFVFFIRLNHKIKTVKNKAVWVRCHVTKVWNLSYKSEMIKTELLLFTHIHYDVALNFKIKHSKHMITKMFLQIHFMDQKFLFLISKFINNNSTNWTCHGDGACHQLPVSVYGAQRAAGPQCSGPAPLCDITALWCGRLWG